MIKLKRKDLNEAAFISAIVQLNNQRGLDAATTYRVGKFAQQADNHLRKAAELDDEVFTVFKELGKVVVQVDEQGNGSRVWQDPEAEKEYLAKKTLIEEEEVEFKLPKIAFKSIKGLTGVEMIAIEKILEGCPQG